jgi:hypothetical protein
VPKVKQDIPNRVVYYIYNPTIINFSKALNNICKEEKPDLKHEINTGNDSHTQLKANMQIMHFI